LGTVPRTVPGPSPNSQFMSKRGVAFMAGWWNYMAQYHGLFDFQDAPRPAYFAYKLLARVTGTKSRSKAFTLWPPTMTNTRPPTCSSGTSPISPSRPPSNFVGCPNKPGSTASRSTPAPPTNPDESSRLKFQTAETLTPTDARRPVTLEPYGVELWFYTQR